MFSRAWIRIRFHPFAIRCNLSNIASESRDHQITESLMFNKYNTLTKIIYPVDTNREMLQIAALDTMAMIYQSRLALFDIRVIHCFRKAVITKESQQKSKGDTDDPFTQLAEYLGELIVLYFILALS